MQVRDGRVAKCSNFPISEACVAAGRRPCLLAQICLGGIAVWADGVLVAIHCLPV